MRTVNTQLFWEILCKSDAEIDVYLAETLTEKQTDKQKQNKHNNTI